MKRFGLILAALIPTHAATTLTVGSVADTTLNGYSFPPSFQVNNMGATPWMNVGQTATSSAANMRGLIQFDLSDLPAGITIVSAKVNVSVVFSPGGSGSTFELHRVLQDWTEGNKDGASGGFADPGETTWLERHAGSVSWGAPGANSSSDIVLQASSTVFMNGPARYTFPSTASLVADVQGWVNNPATNFGFLINSTSTASQSVRRIGSRETGGTAVPTMEVTFNAPFADLKVTSFNVTSTGVTLSWAGGTAPYRIARAESINGPWTFVTTATSATTASAPMGSGTAAFYRVAGNAP